MRPPKDRPTHDDRWTTASREQYVLEAAEEPRAVKEAKQTKAVI